MNATEMMHNIELVLSKPQWYLHMRKHAVYALEHYRVMAECNPVLMPLGYVGVNMHNLDSKEIALLLFQIHVELTTKIGQLPQHCIPLAHSLVQQIEVITNLPRWSNRNVAA